MSRAHVRIIETNSHICGIPWLSKIQIFLHCSYGLHSASDSGSQRVLAVGVGFGSGHGFRASKPFTWADEGCISVEAAHVPMQLEESIISPFGKRPVRVLGRRMVSQCSLGVRCGTTRLWLLQAFLRGMHSCLCAHTIGREPLFVAIR